MSDAEDKDVAPSEKELARYREEPRMEWNGVVETQVGLLLLLLLLLPAFL